MNTDKFKKLNRDKILILELVEALESARTSLFATQYSFDKEMTETHRIKTIRQIDLVLEKIRGEK